MEYSNSDVVVCINNAKDACLFQRGDSFKLGHLITWKVNNDAHF